MYVLWLLGIFLNNRLQSVAIVYILADDTGENVRPEEVRTYHEYLI